MDVDSLFQLEDEQDQRYPRGNHSMSQYSILSSPGSICQPTQLRQKMVHKVHGIQKVHYRLNTCIETTKMSLITITLESSVHYCY